MKWQEATNKVINRYGYLVLGSDKELPIGYVAKGVWYEHQIIRHPFVVIAESSFEEYKEQCVFVGNKKIGSPRSIGNYFYRAVTD